METERFMLNHGQSVKCVRAADSRRRWAGMTTESMGMSYFRHSVNRAEKDRKFSPPCHCSLSRCAESSMAFTFSEMQSLVNITLTYFDKFSCATSAMGEPVT